MVDELAGQPVAEAASAPTVPALSQADIETIVERKAQELADKRFAGYQSALDKKLAERDREIQRLKRAYAGDEDDTPDPRIADLEAELARVQREAQEAEFARKYPDVFEDWKALTAVDDDAARFEYLRKLKVPVSAAPTPDEDEPDIELEVPTPPVHPNQPARTPRGWVPGTAMDAQTAEAFFKGLTEWPT